MLYHNKPRTKTGPKYKYDHARIESLLRDGKSPTDIMLEVGCNRPLISQIRLKAGLPRVRKEYTRLDHRDIQSLIDTGKTISEVAECFGVGTERIYRMINVGDVKYQRARITDEDIETMGRLAREGYLEHEIGEAFKRCQSSVSKYFTKKDLHPNNGRGRWKGERRTIVEDIDKAQ